MLKKCVERSEKIILDREKMEKATNNNNWKKRAGKLINKQAVSNMQQFLITVEQLYSKNLLEEDKN